MAKNRVTCEREGVWPRTGSHVRGKGCGHEQGHM